MAKRIPDAFLAAPDVHEARLPSRSVILSFLLPPPSPEKKRITLSKQYTTSLRARRSIAAPLGSKFCEAGSPVRLSSPPHFGRANKLSHRATATAAFCLTPSGSMEPHGPLPPPACTFYGIGHVPISSFAHQSHRSFGPPPLLKYSSPPPQPPLASLPLPPPSLSVAFRSHPLPRRQRLADRRRPNPRHRFSCFTRYPRTSARFTRGDRGE